VVFDILFRAKIFLQRRIGLRKLEIGFSAGVDGTNSHSSQAIRLILMELSGGSGGAHFNLHSEVRIRSH
jgi:hypothetical protein